VLYSVLNKLMDIAEGKQGAPAPTATAKDFSDGRVPNLTHTKILSAQIGGKALGQSDTNWNRFLDRVILEAATKLNDVKALKQLIIINHVVGKKENQGYRHLPKAGISVQGQDSEAAWKAASHILKAMHMTAEVVFMWYENERAAHPGQTGRLAVG